MTVIVDENVRFEARVPVLIIGAGACGLVAGLTVKEFGADVVILERDAIPRGSTSLSSGMIPACNTRFQRENGVRDSTEQFAEDIFFKSKGNVDSDVVLSVCGESGRTVEWLVDCYGVQLQLVKGFLSKSGPGNVDTSMFTKEVGTIKRGRLIKKLDEPLFLKNRSVVGPIKADGLYHVFDVFNRYKKGSQKDLASCYDEIYQRLFKKRVAKRRSFILDSLKQVANIYINPEYQ